MNCQKIEIFLRDNPGAALPAQARSHVDNCPDCLALVEEQRRLEYVLRDQPRPELPPHFKARLRARIDLADAGRDYFAWHPARLSLASCALMVAAVLLLLLRAPVPDNIFSPRALIHEPGPTISPDGRRPDPETNVAVLNPPARELSRIYPVWPGEQDVAENRDLNIVASFYPAAETRDRVNMTIDDRALPSDQYQIEEDYLTITPKGLSPGQHVVLVSLTDRDGREANKSWSFYLLEERS